MGQYAGEQSFLDALTPILRREVEASAANILNRIGPATAARLEALAAIAAAEAAYAHSQRRAETAMALAAELKRQARLLHS
jgi:hypothetical protein